MTSLSPFPELAGLLDSIRDATDDERRTAHRAVSRQPDAAALLATLGLAHVPAHLEDEDDGT